jgi:hypothetical protein
MFAATYKVAFEHKHTANGSIIALFELRLNRPAGFGR